MLFSKAHEKLADSHLDCGSPHLQDQRVFFVCFVLIKSQSTESLYDLLKATGRERTRKTSAGFT